MLLNETDINKLSKLLSLLIDEVTCIDCCRYFIVPTTADCGHTLCRGCWAGRKTCASCGSTVNRKTLKLNLPLQNKTEHTHFLQEEFEKAFHVKLDDFLFDIPAEKKSTQDPTKHVKEWLASSENQFSGPQSSQMSTQDLNNQPHNTESKIQIHSKSSKTAPPKNTIYVGICQDDWDKIEEMPETENICQKENVVGPMDIEPFSSEQFEFSTDNPRRSSRKRDIKESKKNFASGNNSVNKNSESDSKIVKNKKSWANVKRMKKEFSKLNKKNKVKLNVSIEMCKKTQSSANKNVPLSHISTPDDKALNIDENTPINNNANICPPPTKNLDNNQVCGSGQNNFPLEDVRSEDELQKHKEVQNFETSDSRQPTVNKSFSEYNISNFSYVKPVAFIRKGALQGYPIEKSFNKSSNKIFNNNIGNVKDIKVTTDKTASNTDDIEITIKIGNTLTNICIKKKDVQLKVNTDKEIQTSLNDCERNNTNNVSCSEINAIDGHNNVIINIQNDAQKVSQPVIEECLTTKNVEKCTIVNKNVSIVKTSSTKKNTESADTATIQYEITESIEKELSKEMGKADEQNKESCSKKTVMDEDCINDLDLFENDSLKEGYVQSVKSIHHAPSEILVSTMKSNKRNRIDKRASDASPDDLSTHKKMKSIQGVHEYEEIINTSNRNQSKNLEQDSELSNYDAIMGQVFANIDADMAEVEKKDKKVLYTGLEKIRQDNVETAHNPKETSNLCDSVQGMSENVFSMLDQQNKNSYMENTNNLSQTLGQKLCRNTQSIPTAQDTTEKTDDIGLMDPELSTPVQNNDDSESIVEETPQKSQSFSKLKQMNTTNLRGDNTLKNKSLKLKRSILHDAKSDTQSKTADPPNVSIIDLSDVTDETTKNSKHVTVVEANNPRQTLETPQTITKFFDQIKHKSTPVARKSLNFDKENVENLELDPDNTLCPSSYSVVKTTQEREFMSKAFEDSPKSRTLVKYCLAGSCLTPFEISNVKLLCCSRNWQYVDKYTSDVTHLVVSVDEEKKSQRSVKYMRALAAGKWIVSYDWVQMCLQLKNVIDEEPFEALDNTGEPGPRRSRIAKQKIFRGITFFCMPPFSVLDIDTLKEMLRDAGGNVVDEAKAVRVTGSSPALLLAEPESTQEDRFIYLAMELNIVPVNFAWVLNCLGNYSINSVQELLLCPASLLPPATAQWPPELMAKEFD